MLAGMRAIWIAAALIAACGPSATPPDAHAPRATVYLNFDGVMLTPGSDLASANTSAIVTTPTTLPRYLDGASDRQSRVDAITAAVEARLAPYDVEVVTARPSAHGYTMIVVTGDSTAVAGASGISALAAIGCTAPDLHGIGFLFQSSASADTYGPDFKGNLSLAILGFEYLVPPTSTPKDCMCWAASACGDNETPCTVGPAGTAVDTAHACAGAPATIDEGALFTAALGTHP